MHGLSAFKKFICILVPLLFAYTSHTLIVKLSDLHTMAKRSDLIIHGYVGQQTSITDEMGRFITLTEIGVIDGLLGAKTGEVITVYQVGGQRDGLVMPIIGGHSYALGQEVILFGLKLGDTYVSYGAGQGKLDIINGDSAHETVIEDLGDISAVHNTRGKALEFFRPSPLSFPSTSLLKEEIKLMIKSP